MIYFAIAPDGRIKIGTSRNVEERLEQISAYLASPMALLGSIEGSHPLERRIHEYLAEHRIAGEWYRDCPEVRRTIRNLILVGSKAIGCDASVSIVPETRKNRKPRNIGPWGSPITFRDLVQFAAKEDLEEYLGYLTGCSIETADTWLSGSQPAPATALAAVLSDIFSRIEITSPSKDTTIT
jgi:hypothetical protein